MGLSGGLRLKAWQIVGLAIGLFGFAGHGALAQVRPTFEVASVKVHRNEQGQRSSMMNDEPDGINYSGVFLRPCILAAYHLKDYQVEGLEGPQPGADGYDFVAKAGHAVPRKELMAMLQTLLEERFQLKYHTISKPGPVYRLSSKTGKPKLPEATEGEAGSEISAGRPVATKMSLERLAGFLSQFSDLPVVDSTGISGSFSFTLQWTTGDTREDLMRSLFSDVRRQLGLTIERSTMPMQTMFIDHVNLKPH